MLKNFRLADEMLYGDNISETVNFLRVMNRFFDCMNVRNLFEGRNKRNPDLNPYRSTDDDRLRWLKEDFLQYFTCVTLNCQLKTLGFHC
jgi:hypothetical protein